MIKQIIAWKNNITFAVKNVAFKWKQSIPLFVKPNAVSTSVVVTSFAPMHLPLASFVDS